MTRTTVSSETLLGANYVTISLEASEYNPSIDSDVLITATVLDVYGDPVSGMSLTLYDNGTSVSASITNNNGVASWTVTFEDWDNHHFNVENVSLELKATGWKTIQSVSNYTVLANGEFVRIDFKQGSNATVPQSYDYTLPNGYYPKYPVAAISSTIGDDGIHYAAFKVDTSGNLSVVLRRNTYNTAVGTIYGQLVYPY